jgi:hypothetical protein
MPWPHTWAPCPLLLRIAWRCSWPLAPATPASSSTTRPPLPPQQNHPLTLMQQAVRRSGPGPGPGQRGHLLPGGLRRQPPGVGGEGGSGGAPAGRAQARHTHEQLAEGMQHTRLAATPCHKSLQHGGAIHTCVYTPVLNIGIIITLRYGDRPGEAQGEGQGEGEESLIHTSFSWYHC